MRGRVWCCAICFFAAATMFSMLKPNFFNKCLRGADAPNVSIQTLCPSQPVYLLQPKSDACSTDTRAFTFRGRTDSRQLLSWSSNNSQDGILTTRTRTPSLLNFSYACRQSATSLPVPMRMTSGSAPGHRPERRLRVSDPRLLRTSFGRSWARLGD